MSDDHEAVFLEAAPFLLVDDVVKSGEYWRDKLGVSEEMFPESQRAYERLATLPLFSSMTDEMHASVVDAVKELLC